MDPVTGLGAGASAVQLADLAIRLAGQLFDFCKKVLSAEEDAEGLENYLSDIVELLRRAKSFGEYYKNHVAPKHESDHLADLLPGLRGCIDELTYLQQNRTLMQRRPGKGFSRYSIRSMRWASESEKINKSLKRLEDHKSNLVGTMVTVGR
jgi:hypothetical protein